MRQELDCDVALQLRVSRAVHLAHAARAEQRLHLIHTEPPALDRQLCGVRSAVARTTAGDSRKLFARSSDARSDSTSWRSASLPAQASER